MNMKVNMIDTHVIKIRFYEALDQWQWPSSDMFDSILCHNKKKTRKICWKMRTKLNNLKKSTNNLLKNFLLIPDICKNYCLNVFPARITQTRVKNHQASVKQAKSDDYGNDAVCKWVKIKRRKKKILVLRHKSKKELPKNFLAYVLKLHLRVSR